MWKSLKGRQIAASLGVVMVASFIGVQANAQEVTFGSDIPLGAAAKQIVPNGYKVEYGQGVDSNVNVSWGAEDSWKKAINKAASSAGYSVATSGKVVKIVKNVPKDEVLGSEEPKAEKDAAKAPVAHRQHHRHHYARPHHARVADEGADEVSGPSVPASGFVMLQDGDGSAVVDSGRRSRNSSVSAGSGGGFVASSGKTLASVLRDWSEKSGWRVEWKSSYSYMLTESARFDGDFVQATSELVRSLSNARPQPTVSFYVGNKVVVVGNDLLDEGANASN